MQNGKCPGPFPKNPALIVSLRAKKAFDRVKWSFLFSLSEKLVLCSSFINMIKILYSDPIATVNTNMRRGCRQGCPLSPLLFTLFIEPLADRHQATVKDWWSFAVSECPSGLQRMISREGSKGWTNWGY